MFFLTVMCGQSAYDWKTIPRFRLFGGTLIPRDASKTAPSPISMLPSSPVSRPAMQRRVVVFPQPLGPRRTRNSPGSISRSRLSIATIGDLPPNRFVNPRTLTLDNRASPAFGEEGERTASPAPLCDYYGWNSAFQRAWKAAIFAGVKFFRSGTRGET